MLATIKVTAEQTGGQYALVEILAPDGYEGVLHVHHFEDEGFYILEGEMTFYVGDQTIMEHLGKQGLQRGLAPGSVGRNVQRLLRRLRS